MSGESRAVPGRQQRQLVVLARWPAPGRCKGRLAAGIGAGPAARVQARLTGHTLAAVRAARRRLPFELVLAVSPLGPRAAGRWARHLGLPRVVPQGTGGLGIRMQRQQERARREGARQVVLVGSDLPQLAAGDVLAAFAALEQRPLVLGPAADGGYWLVGLRLEPGPGPGMGPAPLFSGIAWGTDQVLEQTCAAAGRWGLPLALLAERADLDRPADLRPWR
ncbi:MAG: TIGR04282 family arsenosugar biosynthesis glycosyltransferase [Synechococcus sp.]|nr:TIGR04282 family arsenosugar biosynthesis glycosyltransferase [Synechococcus sp.]